MSEEKKPAKGNTMGCVLLIFGIIALIAIFSGAFINIDLFRGKFGVGKVNISHDGKPCSIKVLAKLRPAELNSTIEIKFTHSSGYVGAEQAATATIQLDQATPEREIEVGLPGAGKYDWSVTSRSQLIINNMPMVAKGSDNGTNQLKEGVRLVYGIDTSNSKPQQTPQGWVMPFRPFLQTE